MHWPSAWGNVALCELANCWRLTGKPAGEWSHWPWMQGSPGAIAFWCEPVKQSPSPNICPGPLLGFQGWPVRGHLGVPLNSANLFGQGRFSGPPLASCQRRSGPPIVCAGFILHLTIIQWQQSQLRDQGLNGTGTQTILSPRSCLSRSGARQMDGRVSHSLFYESPGLCFLELSSWYLSAAIN